MHVVSHCPFLIAQYARYKGRDVFSTAKALLDVGYTMPRLVSATTLHSLIISLFLVSNRLDEFKRI